MSDEKHENYRLSLVPGGFERRYDVVVATGRREYVVVQRTFGGDILIVERDCNNSSDAGRKEIYMTEAEARVFHAALGQLLGEPAAEPTGKINGLSALMEEAVKSIQAASALYEEGR